MLKRLARRLGLTRAAAAPDPAPGVPEPAAASVSFPKFHGGPPSHQAALDLFKGRWASRLPAVGGQALVAGTVPHFDADPRPHQAIAAFGGPNGRLDGFRVLELGPLEGGHTYTLETYGADVLAIEGNAEAYLKCLIAKEVLGMRSRFMLGDFMAHLRDGADAYDLIFASGVLYHMAQPLELIDLICRRGARALVWTHYYDPARAAEFDAGETDTRAGVSATHYRKWYADRAQGTFWGGLEASARWLPREDILAAFRAFGHTRIEVVDEQRDSIGGPSFTLVTSR